MIVSDDTIGILPLKVILLITVRMVDEMRNLWLFFFIILFIPILLGIEQCGTPLEPIGPLGITEKVILVQGVEITFLFGGEKLFEISARDLNEGVWAYLAVSQIAEDGRLERVLYRNTAPILKNIANKAEVENGPVKGEKVLIEVKFLGLPGLAKPTPFKGVYVLGESKVTPI